MKIHEVIALLGGLALFLFGLQLMINKLERVFGKALRGLVPVMAKNRVAGLFAGTVMTCVMQSSSAVTAAIIGLANAGVLTIGCALGAIVGANIGSTVTGLLLCLSTQWSAAIAVAGLVLIILFRRDRMRQAGQMLVSVGVLLLGLRLMTEAMETMKTWEGMIYLTLGMEYPWLSVLLGAGVAALLQSSAATVGILQALAMQGILPLNTALYALLGANIGTCVSAVIAAAGANVTARRAAAVHILFNLLGAGMFYASVEHLPVLDYVQMLSGDSNMQLALLHVAFNVGSSAVLMILSPVLLLLSRLFAHGKVKMGCLKQYDERQLSVPFIALLQLEKEVQRLGEMAKARMQMAIACWQGGENEEESEDLALIVKAVSQGLLLVQGKTGNERDSARIGCLLRASAQFEYIAYHADRWADLSEKCEDFGEEELDDLLLFAHKALGAVETAQLKTFSRKLSGEEEQSMQLLLADAKDCAQELIEKCAAHVENGAAYQAALQEIACVTEAAGQLIAY